MFGLSDPPASQTAWHSNKCYSHLTLHGIRCLLITLSIIYTGLFSYLLFHRHFLPYLWVYAELDTDGAYGLG